MKTIYEVADELHVHWQTIRNMINRKEIHAVKVGKQWRISEEEVDRIKKGG